MSLQINTTRAKIAINTTKGRFSIQQPRGEQSIKQIPAKMKIDRELLKVKIDQYQSFAEAGLKNYLDLTKEGAQLGRQRAMEAIARIVQDGNRLARIEKNMPPAIPELAEKNAWRKQREYNIGTIPKSRPKIEVTGHLNIEWQLGGTEINYTPRKPIINFQRGKVEVYMQQKPSIDLQYVDNRV